MSLQMSTTIPTWLITTCFTYMWLGLWKQGTWTHKIWQLFQTFMTHNFIDYLTLTKHMLNYILRKLLLWNIHTILVCIKIWNSMAYSHFEFYGISISLDKWGSLVLSNLVTDIILIQRQMTCYVMECSLCPHALFSQAQSHIFSKCHYMCYYEAVIFIAR